MPPLSPYVQPTAVFFFQAEDGIRDKLVTGVQTCALPIYAAGAERVVSIVGTDEIDLNRNHISWVSPLGRALMKSAAGDSVVLQLPGGTEYLTVLEVCYERISVEPFREPPGSEASAKGLPRRR